MQEFVETELSVLDRGLNLLELLATYQELSLPEIQDRLQMKRSTAYRYISSLAAHGYVEKEDSGKYMLGKKIIMLAGYYLNDVDLITAAQPVLRKYSRLLNLSMYMAILDRSEAITVVNEDINRAGQGNYTKVGDKFSAISTAMGRCLLAGLSGNEFESVVSNLRKGRSRVTQLSEEELRKQIIFEVRERGYVIDDGEFDPEIRCVAAPVYDYHGDIIASVCACGEKYELSLKRCRVIADQATKCAEEISRRNGYM